MDKEKDIEIIFEVSKSDTVQKFNPFHDARGRFASSRGFKTYSANPKTKAGAMAITRSNNAGHGRTLNVHRESKGESIRQNANWLSTGQKPKVPAAVSRARYQQRKQKQQAAAAQQTASKPSTASQKPTAQKPQTTQTPKTTQQQNSANGSLNGFKGSVSGKDISKTFNMSYAPNSGSAVQQVAKQQGYLGKPKLVSSSEFYKAAAKSGVVGFRTWSDGTDVTTGKRVTAKNFKDDLSNKDEISLNGSGGQVYGGGIYIATTANIRMGTMPKSGNIRNAVNDSLCYGKKGQRATAAVTLSPSAVVGDGYQISKAFQKQGIGVTSKFGNDVGAYAASLGYDALKWKNAGCGCDYTTVYNRTKLIVLDDPSNSAFGIRN